MKLLPITLGVARPEPGAGLAARKKGSTKGASAGGKLPAELKAKIHESDKHTCRFCGFQARKYQEVLARNHDLSDHDPKNLVTVCIFCQQCFMLDKVADMRSGFLMWLPEIDQPDLHHIARALYVGRISQGPAAEASRQILEHLATRREEAKSRLGTDNPAILATVLKDYLGPRYYQNRTKKLDGVRLFPLDRRSIKEAGLEFNQFPQILAYWRSKDGPFGGKVPNKWISLYQEIMARPQAA